MFGYAASCHHAHAPVDIPPERGLRLRLSVSLSNLSQYLICEDVFQSLAQGRPCLGLYAQFPHISQGGFLMIERMQFHLVDHRRDLAAETQIRQALRAEIAHTHCPLISIGSRSIKHTVSALESSPHTALTFFRIFHPQHALSRSMQRLEDELGVKLFDRQKSRLTLNENGELAVRCARSLILQETSMIEQIREFDRKKRTISVGSCTPILVPDFVSLLSRLYEGMTISTELTGEPHLEKHLRDNKYQLAILHERPDEKEFYSLPIESEHLYVFLPPVHPLADAQGLYLRDLDGQTFLLYSQIGFWDGLCRREMPSARFLLQQDYEVLGELVQNSALPSFTTDYVLKREPFESDRIAVPILDEEANVTYYCACLRSEKSRFRDVFRNLQTFHGNSHL